MKDIYRGYVPTRNKKSLIKFSGNAKLLTLDEVKNSEEYAGILAEDVIHVGYKKDTISGKNEVVEYWKGWRTRYVETRKCKKFEVVYSNYYSNACLLLEMMVVMFIFRDNKIQKILLIQRHLSPTIGFHEDVLEPQFDLSCIKHCLSELRQPNEIGGPVVKENRIPCMTCGMPSEQLEWHSSLFEFGDIAYSGDVSVCTHCHKVVEYEPIIRHRYAEPVEMDQQNERRREHALYDVRDLHRSAAMLLRRDLSSSQMSA